MNPDRTPPYRLAHARRDTIGMCDALLDVLVPSRVEQRVGGVDADSGPSIAGTDTAVMSSASQRSTHASPSQAAGGVANVTTPPRPRAMVCPALTRSTGAPPVMRISKVM